MSSASSPTSSGTPIRPATLAWGGPGGPRVLLVHGLSSVAGSWWRVGAGLAEAGCSVVAPDLRGHGQSPSAMTYRFSDHANDLATLGDSWDLIVGHSLAGPIVALVAAQTGNARRLLLLDPMFDIPDPEFEVVVADQLSEIDPNASAEDYEGDYPGWHPEDRFRKAVGARATSPFVIEQCLRDNAPYHHLELLEVLVMRTRILLADPTVGTMSLAESFDRIKNPVVTHIQIDGAGHSIQRDRPDLVIEHALDLLNT